MISLRRTFTFTRLLVAALSAGLVAGCNDGLTNPHPGARSPSGSANFDGKVGDTGDAAKHGSIAVRVLLDRSGNAFLDVHTGTFDGATNTPHPDGYFQSLQYKVYDAAGKQRFVRHVDFKTAGETGYLALIDLCAKGDGDADDPPSPSCSAHFDAGWTVDVQANLKGVGADGDKTDVVRAIATQALLPDIDLSSQPIWVGSGTSRTSLTQVVPGVPTVYSVDFANLTVAGQPSTVGAQDACAVVVDGETQGLPSTSNTYAFAYASAPVLTVAAGATATCSFSLTLPAGPHTISVTAVPLSPGDYDITNNSTGDRAFQARVSGPPDVAAVSGGLTMDAAGTAVPAGALTIPAGQTSVTTTFHQTVQLVSGAPPSSTTCSVSVDGAAQTFTTAPLVQPALGVPGSTGICNFPLTFSTTGSHTIAVTAVASGDVNHANDAASSAVTVALASAPITANLAVSAIALGSSPLDNATPPSVAVRSGVANTYNATIGVTNLTNAATLPVACTVQVDGHDVTAAPTTNIIGSTTTTVAFAWVSGKGPAISVGTVGGNGTGTCSFTLTLTESGNADVVHTVTVGASSNGTTTPIPVTTLSDKVTDQVRVDVAAQSVVRLYGGSPIAVDTTKMGTTDTIQVALESLEPAGGKSTTVQCAVTLPAAPADTAPTSLKWIGSNTVTLGPAGSANNVGTCTYSVALPYLGAFPLKLTATPTAGNPADPDLSNNSIIGTVTVKSSGAFTTNSTIINLAQQWSTAAPTGFPVTNMSLQRVQVDQLALLVLPTQATLGYFSIDSATISQPNSSGVKVSFGNGTASGTVLKSDAGTKCVSNGVFTQTPLNPVVEPQLSYFADICAQPQLDAGGSPNGFQVITVTFEQSLTGTVAAPQPDYVFNPGSTVTVRIVMSFTLNGSTYHDRVSATVNIKVPPAISGLQDIVTGLTSWNLGPLNQSDPTQVSITSP